jgi:hypothetical protein
MCSGCSPKLDWRDFHAVDGGFTVLLPQKPGQAEHRFATPLGEIVMKMYSARIDETVLAAGYADFAAPLDAHALDLMRDALVRSLGGALVNEKPVTAGALNGREVLIAGAAVPGGKAPQLEMRARLFARDKRYFQVVLAGRKGGFEPQDAAMFLESFRAD